MLKKYKINNQLNYLYYPTKKFKSFVIKIYFFIPFDKKKITIRNLLKSILLYNTKEYSNQDLFMLRKKMYNLNFNMELSGSYNLHKYILTIKGTSPKYFEDEDYNLKEIFKVINEIIFRPNINDNLFNQESYEYCYTTYKNSLIKFLEEKENLILYENEKLLDKLDVNNHSPLGYLEDFDSITNEKLYEEYLKLLNSKIILAAAGDLNKDELRSNFKKYFNKYEQFNEKYLLMPTKYQKPKTKTIKLRAQQSLLMMTFATEIAQFSDKYFDLLIFNLLYGEDSSSKLFQVIREEYGYCYDIYSFFDVAAGTITVYMGIDKKNINQAKRLVIELLEEIQNGNFTKKHLELLIKNNYYEKYELYDNLENSLRREVNMFLHNRDASLKKLKESLKNVDKESIIECSKKLKLISTICIEAEDGEE